MCMHINNPFAQPKTEPKVEIKPDYIALLLDLAQRVETLEKHIAKLHTKQSPGRPPSQQNPQLPEGYVGENATHYYIKRAEGVKMIPKG